MTSNLSRLQAAVGNWTSWSLAYNGRFPVQNFRSPRRSVLRKTTTIYKLKKSSKLPLPCYPRNFGGSPVTRAKSTLIAKRRRVLRTSSLFISRPTIAQIWIRFRRRLGLAGGVVSTWSRPSLPTAKYFDSGWLKYQPLTLLAGLMAQLSVSVMPVAAVASSSAKERGLFRVVGAGGIAGRGTDAAVFFADDVLHLQVLGAAVAAEFAGALVHQFGERLGETVAEGLGHDGGVVVVLRLELGGEVARRHGRR
jgi:hypothetical protein